MRSSRGNVGGQLGVGVPVRRGDENGGQRRPDGTRRAFEAPELDKYAFSSFESAGDEVLEWRRREKVRKTGCRRSQKEENSETDLYSASNSVGVMTDRGDIDIDDRRVVN